MSTSQDARDVSDDRSLPTGQSQVSTDRGGASVTGPRTYRYETTADGDVVITDPSFDDVPEADGPAKKRATGPTSWHSPVGIRNPVSSKRHNRHHSRNLSAHFFDATKITEDDDEAQVEKTFAKVKPEVNPAAMGGPPPAASPCVGQKHRRMFSGDVSNPPLAHRRINSIGNAAAVDRFLQRPRTRHRREDSAGLDILSAAADVTNDELADAAGAARSSPYWDPQPPAPPGTGHHTRLSSLDYYDYGAPAPTSRPPGPLKPPPARTYPHQHAAPHPHPYGPPGSHHAPVAYHHHPPPHGHHAPVHYYYPPPPGHHGPPPPGHHGPPPPGPPPPGHAPPPPPPPRSAYPVQYSHRPRPSELVYKSHLYPPPAEENSGRQPSPTTPYGDAKIESDERLFESRAASASEAWKGSYPPPPPMGAPVLPEGKPTQEAEGSDPLMTKSATAITAHHRKLSSFSSIGALMGPSMFPPSAGAAPPADTGEHPLKSHHRSTSSSISFLNGLDVLEGSDVMFLRNLHASTPNYGGPPSSAGPPPLGPPSDIAPPVPTSSAAVAVEVDKPMEAPESSATGMQLAAGGTSKRVRRKCTVADCPNRVVQGGLCISHGAKRKTCKHPGCEKNVKKAGLCSTHGPARKRCEAGGCGKVAVQGGRCIAHGAKKKLCCVENCKKQAILSGMCKKHHDKLGGVDPNGAPVCVVIAGNEGGAQSGQRSQKGHHRGLSIFQDLSADAVHNLLAGEDPLAL